MKKSALLELIKQYDKSRWFIFPSDSQVIALKKFLAQDFIHDTTDIFAIDFVSYLYQASFPIETSFNQIYFAQRKSAFIFKTWVCSDLQKKQYNHLTQQELNQCVLSILEAFYALAQYKLANIKNGKLLTQQPQHIREVTFAIHLLGEWGIANNDNLVYLIEHAQQAYQIAREFCALHQFKLLNKNNCALLIQHLDAAHEIMAGLRILKRHQLINQDNFIALMQHPENAPQIADMLSKAGLTESA